MTNLRWLKYTVPGFKDEFTALILIHQFCPAPTAEDQLKSNLVVMDIIGHRAAAGNMDMRGNKPATLSVWNQVSVAHSRTTHTPGGTGIQPSDHQ